MARCITSMAVWTFAWVATASAQDASDPYASCRAAFERAESAYGSELFTEAEDGYRQAFDCMPPTAERRVLILINIAYAVERQGGRDQEALDLFRRFRRDAEGIADPELLVRADARIRELEERLARRGGGGGGGVHPIGPILLAAGGAAIVAGIIVGAYGLSERGAVLAECSGTTCPAIVEERAASLNTYGMVTDALLWPGVAIAAVGAVLTFVLREDGGEAPAVACGPIGCVARWRW